MYKGEMGGVLVAFGGCEGGLYNPPRKFFLRCQKVIWNFTLRVSVLGGSELAAEVTAFVFLSDSIIHYSCCYWNFEL